MCFLWLLLLPLLLWIVDLTTGTTVTTMAPPPIPPPRPDPQPIPPTISPTVPPPTFPPRPEPEPPTERPPWIGERFCKLFGDPHVETFDGQHASFYSQGEYWIVKSNEVWIQGRYMATPVTNGL